MGKMMKRQSPPNKKWNDTMYLKAYLLARSCQNDSDVAKALGVSTYTFAEWLQTKPALRDALDRARPVNGQTETLEHYVYDRLSDETKELWDQITAYEKESNGVVMVRKLLQNRGNDTLMSLYFHSLIHNGFNESMACRTIGISATLARRWKEDNPRFAELAEEFKWHRKNFYEHGLVELVARRDTAAVIFANKTANADRGYGDTRKVKHEHGGSIEHNHNMIPVDELPLPVEVKKLILEKYREWKERQSATAGLDAPVPRRIAHEEE